jgi:hypothetical protein
MGDERDADRLSGGGFPPPGERTNEGAPACAGPAGPEPGPPGDLDAELTEDVELASWAAPDTPSWTFLLSDPELDALWASRRWRRVAVRVLGWVAIAGAAAATGELLMDEPAREAIGCWATMGQIEPPTGPVRSALPPSE